MFGAKRKKPEPSEQAALADDGRELFDVILETTGMTPFAVAQAISTESIPGRNFVNTKQAKALADQAPSVVAERIDAPYAQRYRLALESAGATVRIVPHGGAASPDAPPAPTNEGP